jgi:Putative lumazine-binding
MSDTPENINEYAAIKSLIQRYIDAAKYGRGHDMKLVFHSDATIFGHVGDDMLAGSIQQLFSWHDENGPAKALHAHIASIDLINTAATVRLELDNWTGYRFTDLFTLLKIDGKWNIMNKVFHLHSKQTA